MKAPLDEARALLEADRPWAGLGGDALAFVLAQVASQGRWLVVLDGEDRAEQLARALRFFFAHPERIDRFPADDNRPYDGFSPDPALPRARLKVLDRLERQEDLVVVTTARALLQRVPDAATRRAGTLVVEQGARIDRDVLVAFLTDAGYLGTARADEPGRFVVRGDVLDVWPTGNKAPVRIDLFDDEVERLRRLDPETLLPSAVGKRVTLLPAREERLDGAALDRALGELARYAAEAGGDTESALLGNPAVRRRQVVEELRAGIRFSGLQDWLPALVPTVAPLEALGEMRIVSPATARHPLAQIHGPSDLDRSQHRGFRRRTWLTRLVVVYPDDVHAALRDAESTLYRRYELLEPDERPLVPPSARYVPARDVLAALKRGHEVLELASDRAPDLGARPTDELAVRGSELAPSVAKLQALAEQDVRVALVVKDEARSRRLVELLQPHGLRIERADDLASLEAGKISLLLGDLPKGFLAPESGWAFVPVSALFGTPRRASADRAHALWSAGVSSPDQLKQDDPVVHRVHGVGLYRGLQRLQIQPGAEQDFVKLEYRDGDLLFLPVAALEQLSRYAPSNSDATPALDKLGGQTFEKRKGKVRDNLLAMAQDLVRLYAKREVATREPYPDSGPRMVSFEARFPYQETPDQRAAIDAVMEDLSRPYPMDRLICGDVGFGKTEVAMRAAMRAVEGGRQVGVLCPTTVLAHQHLRTFRERFAADGSVNIGMWSRFTTAAELARLKAGMADGSVHIVVGTTSLLGREARFADLGLVVIDEEHRFGVKQKDRLKRMRSEVDVLALSATPIPRTLQLALSGVREMSLIATPPASRLAVRTTLARFTESRVRDAMLTEIERGGQCWFVHNRIESIEMIADKLREWVPQARMAVAHGQMQADELERVLVDFVERRYDVLVCTAIVESGVDLPNVNTMLVDRADLLGLAQLYQLRGRVGRGDRRANCILLTPEEMTTDARKRLRVIVENQALGSGFSVASADLTLRGGGNFLGAAQSGNIDQVGYDTWVELLEQTVHHVRGELDRERIDPEVDVPVPAFLPDILVPDTDERLVWYRRLSHSRTTAEIERVVGDLESEHGELPEPARNLADLVAIRLLCREQGIVRCAWLKVRVLLELHPKSPLHASRLQAALERHPKRFIVDKREGAQGIGSQNPSGDASAASGHAKGRGPIPGATHERVRTLSVRFTPNEGEKPLRYLRWVFAQLAREQA